MNRYIAGLTPLQIAFVLGVFVFTLIGAVLLAWAFRKWNQMDKKCPACGKPYEYRETPETESWSKTCKCPPSPSAKA